MVVKDGYKLTEVGVIPEDWEVFSIDQLAIIKTGSRNTQDRIESGAYPFFVRSQTIERINTYSFDGEAVLTAGDGVGVGKVMHYINGKFDCHQRVYRISDFRENINGYYFYLFFSENFLKRIMQMTAKSSVDSVRMEMIADMPIPLPPTKSEQTAIATALSDADALIRSLEKQIEKKRAIKQGAMQDLLKPKEGWGVKRLGEICSKITTGKLDANSMREDGEYRFYTCAKAFYFIDHYAFDEEALLVSGNGENVGYVHYYKGKFNAYQRTYVLYGFDEIIGYIKLFLDRYLQDRIVQEVNSGNTPYIKMGTLTDMEIILPSSRIEQEHIAEILGALESEISSLDQKLTKYKMLKQGMMQELLTGRIRLV